MCELFLFKATTNKAMTNETLLIIINIKHSSRQWSPNCVEIFNGLSPIPRKNYVFIFIIASLDSYVQGPDFHAKCITHVLRSFNLFNFNLFNLLWRVFGISILIFCCISGTLMSFNSICNTYRKKNRKILKLRGFFEHGRSFGPQRMSLTVEHLKHLLIILVQYCFQFIWKFWFAYTCLASFYTYFHNFQCISWRIFRVF